MLTLRLHSATPSWHCGVPADPSRWRKRWWEKPPTIVAEYTAEEFAWMLACCADMPMVVVLRALELAARGEGLGVRG